jgi:hypothetical protein
VAVDPVRETFNGFLYSGLNPINFYDPDGERYTWRADPGMEQYTNDMYKKFRPSVQQAYKEVHGYDRLVIDIEKSYFPHCDIPMGDIRLIGTRLGSNGDMYVLPDDVSSFEHEILHTYIHKINMVWHSYGYSQRRALGEEVAIVEFLKGKPVTNEDLNSAKLSTFRTMTKAEQRINERNWRRVANSYLKKLNKLKKE